MVSTTSGSTSLTYDIDELIESAFENVGGEHTSGEDQAKARRALNYILIQLQNRGIPLNKITTTTLSLVKDTSSYTLDQAISDVLEVTYKDGDTSIERVLNRYSLAEFHNIANKTQSGVPTIFTTERGTNNVKLKIWPTPDNTNTLEVLSINRVEDVTASYQKIDLPYRFYPLLVMWLSYELSLKSNDVDINKRQELKNNYLDELAVTFEEDRERVDMRIVPKIGGY